MMPEKTAEEKYAFVVTEDDEGERADRLIALALDRTGSRPLSRTTVKKLIASGKAFAGDACIKKPSAVLRAGDLVTLLVPPPQMQEELIPQDIPLSILYEDDDLLIVDKPKGMVVHPSAGHTDGTLVNAVMFHCGSSLSGIGGIMRPGIVHRIDRDTTGALVVCKNDAAHLGIAAQLKEHKLGRVYEALVYGNFREDSGTIDLPIARSKSDRKKMAVDPENGKAAVTHYRVLKRFLQDRISYVECVLETGRTHQIRVHMNAAGHPLLGDEVYAPGRKSRFSGLQGQCLHAAALDFLHPVNGSRIAVRAPRPAYFAHLLEVLR